MAFGQGIDAGGADVGGADFPVPDNVAVEAAGEAQRAALGCRRGMDDGEVRGAIQLAVALCHLEVVPLGLERDHLA